MEEREPVGCFDGEGLPVLGVTNVAGVTHTGIEASDDKSKYLRLRPNRFVYNPYRVNVGSLGLTTSSQNGITIPAYVIFRSTDALDSRFLYHFLKSRHGNQLINFHGNRGTVRAALRFPDLSQIEIPLPSLSEQRRIVARIEQLSAKIEEARGLRKQQEQEMRHMLLGAFWSISKDAPRYRMCEVAPQVRRPVQVAANGLYPELGIRSFGKGTFHKAALSGLEIGSKRVFWIKPGDLLFSNVFAWEGAITVAKPDDQDRVGSHRYITCVPKKDITTASFLCFYFLTNEGLELIRGASPGGAGRNRTIGLAVLDAIQVPIPSLADQLWFDEFQSNVDKLKRLQQETSTELDTLLPSVFDRAFKGAL